MRIRPMRRDVAAIACFGENIKSIAGAGTGSLPTVRRGIRGLTRGLRRVGLAAQCRRFPYILSIFPDVQAVSVSSSVYLECP